MIAKILDGLVPGIVSGLVTTGVLFLVLQYWSRLFVPWFEERLYKGIKIDRVWRAQLEGREDLIIEITLRQSAHRIWGAIIWKNQGFQSEYELEGEFRDLILTATYKQKNLNTLDRGTLALLCMHNGELLRGCYSWYDVKSSKIICGNYECTPAFPVGLHSTNFAGNRSDA